MVTGHQLEADLRPAGGIDDSLLTHQANPKMMGGMGSDRVGHQCPPDDEIQTELRVLGPGTGESRSLLGVDRPGHVRHPRQPVAVEDNPRRLTVLLDIWGLWASTAREKVSQDRVLPNITGRHPAELTQIGQLVPSSRQIPYRTPAGITTGMDSVDFIKG